MTTMQLQEYVRERRAAGVSQDAIRSELVASGWADADIRSALGEPGAANPSVMASSRGHGRRFWLLIPILLLVGGGAAASYLAFFAASPDKVLAQALNGAMWADASEFSGSLRVEMTVDPDSEQGAKAGQTLALIGSSGEAGRPTKLTLDFDGAFDHANPDDLKSRGAYVLAAEGAADAEPIAGLETRRVGGVTYLSLTKAPKIPFFDVSPLVGTWIKFDLKALAGALGSAPAEKEEKPPTAEPTAEQRDAIGKAFVELRPIAVAETLKDEEVGGVPSRHYRLAVDKENLRAFMMRVQEIMKDQDAAAYKKAADEYDKFDEEVDVKTFEIWIGKKEGLPTRLLLAADATASDDVPGQGTIALDMTFKSFGRPVAIAAPADAKSVEEVLGLLMSGAASAEGGAADGAFPEAEARSRTAARISAVRQYQTGLELGFSENDRYPHVFGRFALGTVPVILCKVGGEPAWTDDEKSCTGTVYKKDEFETDFDKGARYDYLDYGGRWYEITFETETDAGDLTAGPQCANPNGIISGTTCLDEDRDNDGFKDYAELKAGYDPFGPGKLPTP